MSNNTDATLLLTISFQAYGNLLMEKIRHKHTLARNHFSKMAVMAVYFKAEQLNGRRPSSMGSASGGSSSEMEQDNVGVNGTAVTLVA